jgi:hypothetical protein
MERHRRMEKERERDEEKENGNIASWGRCKERGKDTE